MAVNKVIYGGTTLVDLTGDTVTAADLADGVKATGADGNPIVGLMQKVTIDAELSATSTNPVQNKVIYNSLLNKVGTDIFSGFALMGATSTISWGQGSQPIGSINAINYTGTAAMATRDAAGNTISTTYASKADVSALLSTKLGVNSTAYAATRDGAGNNIVDTYAKKTDISGMVKSVNGKEPDAGGNVDLDIIPISQGGTGATTVAGARNNLGLGNTSGAVPIANGGTGATTAKQARANLGIRDVAIEATDYIIESYRNGTEWYEVYKSGKVRQGGQVSKTSTSTSTFAVTLLKKMANTNYGVFTNKTKQSDATDVMVQSGSKTTTKVTFTIISTYNGASINTALTFDWILEGQGA